MSLQLMLISTILRLVNVGLAEGHFNLIVVDEAGQAMEPEIVAVLAPLKIPQVIAVGSTSSNIPKLNTDAILLICTIKQVVLGGDPKQLGPVIHSAAAKKHGLSTSLLERLLARPMYARSTTGSHQAFNGYDPNYVTMLVRNYRSHELLLTVPNALFYHGALQYCVRAEISKSPNLTLPLLPHNPNPNPPHAAPPPPALPSLPPLSSQNLLHDSSIGGPHCR